MAHTVVDISGLSTGYHLKRGGVKILHRNLNVSLSQGELICILGPNGAGKSTLLKTMAGFIRPLEGEILIGSSALKEMTVRALSRLVSVVLTEKIDDIYLTAYEIVMTGRYPYGSFTGHLTDKDKQMIDRAFRQVGTGHLANRSFYSLSDGEKQRVMIARAIVQATPFIFLDEPVAYIDAPGKIGIMQLLKDLSSNHGKGILIATHDIDSALHYADQLWLLGTEGEWKTGMPNDLVKDCSINSFFDSRQVVFNKRNKQFECRG